MNINEITAPFPKSSDGGADGKQNPAISLYGRRFYKDQTPVEYLAEFLLVFVSPKCDDNDDQDGAYSFRPCSSSDSGMRYWPRSAIALKLFAFFPASKLETRHPVHRKAYLAAVDRIRSMINSNREEQDETVRLVQSLLGGFVGIAKNRTWVTHSFLPASTMLLSRELDWLHSKAKKDPNLKEWSDAEKYFARDRHNFMARGGELLFLQLANLFSDPDGPEISTIKDLDEYSHLAEAHPSELEVDINNGLKWILEDAIRPLNALAGLIEKQLDELTLKNDSAPASLGWVPQVSRVEAFLFAVELRNICSLKLSSLEKLDLLQLLCCFQVLRSLCFQASRLEKPASKTFGFIGNYAWIVSNPESSVRAADRKMAQSCVNRIDAILYRVLRNKSLLPNGKTGSMREADEHGFKIFKKISKEVGLIVPRKGGGERFVLNPSLIRFLVAALVRPGDYVPLNEFYNRVFAHYGIAIGGDPLATAVDWSSGSSGEKSYGLDVSTGWVEEALQQGGFLIELSDAVSIVHNPGGGEVKA